ncbi:hypothetical protein [Olivibacter sp. XZL3]|uniref:hypothetical protein n=1 Tax=Olivibacter sp. XZL3 TaxID=1735116 RepID=UPI0010669061|nr:hypothetical protein [Olivibacter sp. XZL3]
MKNISDFYEKSGDWLFNLGDPVSNMRKSRCTISQSAIGYLSCILLKNIGKDTRQATPIVKKSV